MLFRKLFTYGLPQGLLTATLAVALLAGGLATQAEAQRRNGTTLAAAKDLNICRVSDNGTPDNASDDTWRYYGTIAVWQEGAVDTQGLAITDWIQFKAFDSSGQFANLYPCDPDTPLDPSVIPAYTPEQSAESYAYSRDAPALNGYIRNSATVTIMNHSGHLGTPFGPEPKATYTGPLGLDVPSCGGGGDDGCAFSWGYWKTHRPTATNSNLITPWPSPYSDTAQFYYAAVPVCVLNCTGNQNDDVYSSGASQTYANVLDYPVGGNAYYQLAHQFIAAQLNVANGALPVLGITGPGGILEQATTWFNTSTNTPASCQNHGNVNGLCGAQGAWAAILEAYNTGCYASNGGPAHCGEDPEPVAACPAIP